MASSAASSMISSLPSANLPTKRHRYNPPNCKLMHLSVAVLGLDVVGEGLGLLELGVVVMTVVVVLGTHVLHLVDAAALGATLNGALAGQLQAPVSVPKSINKHATENLRQAS